MWTLRRRSRRTPGSHRPPTAETYRSTSYLPLRPWQVRSQRFRTCRRGLDPAEVHAFLARVAHDLAAVYAELGRSRDETWQIKNALRDWQTQARNSRERAWQR